MAKEKKREIFEEYTREAEPNRYEKSQAWRTAIGLQDVDGLEASEYLIKTAKRNIEGEISFDETNELIRAYYEENSARGEKGRTEEADKVSARIAELLSEKAFSFTTNEYILIHKILFSEIYEYAGQIRDYNITKKEWVLEGETVIYGSATELRNTLDYDIAEEEKFSYKGLSLDEMIRHLASFVANLWQIHAFGEGNTRTTAVFFIKYLRTLGFKVENDSFATHAWYFRNALVRANYSDLKNGIYETTEYLELFLRNLLLGERHLLRNRDLYIGNYIKEFRESDIVNAKSDIDALERHIEGHYSAKVVQNIIKIYEVCEPLDYFGRRDVMRATRLGESRSSELIKILLKEKIIESVLGYGKGKYKFRRLKKIK